MPDTKTPQKANNTAPAQDFIRQIAKKISEADNILVTLSRNPSVDEISAALGLTLFLDKLGKHATAIYSGATPNVLEFLHPEKTFESNTDSLQDFIVTLNKDKADHLRYNIDGDYVKIYITPYKTTIDESDLEFSHGDYNVDLIIALNVPTPNDLDAALIEHGKIMHDASAIDITTGEPGKFGEIEWSNSEASSVSEMVANLLLTIQDQKNPIGQGAATAFLTGIISATERFSNDKTSPKTMNISSELMKLGADQQLITSNLAADVTVASAASQAEPEEQDPTKLSIDHSTPEAPTNAPAMTPPAPATPSAEPAPQPTTEQPPVTDTMPTEPMPAEHSETQLQPLHDNIVPEPQPTSPAPVAESVAPPAPATPSAEPAPQPAAMPAPQPAPETTSVPAPASAPEIPTQPMGAVDLPPATTPTPVIPATPPADVLSTASGELPPTPDSQDTIKDYGKMMDDALAETTLQGDKPVEPTEPLVTNMAATAAPPVMNQPEVNSVPEISYDQAQPASEANPPQPVPMPEAIDLPPPPNPPMPDVPPMPESAPAAQVPAPETTPPAQAAPEAASAAQPTESQPQPDPQPAEQPAEGMPAPAVTPDMFQIPTA